MTDAPLVRFSPTVRDQLAAATQTTAFGLDVLAVPGMPSDQIAVVSRHVVEAEMRARAAGMEFGPLQWTSEQTPDGWRMSWTAELRPRGTVLR